ncbi:MAG: PKD domain-containing protein [Candidatus Zixiibacteriota bacterium]|nr:MAG: PKD domain-containing protein [candidate division Zixibacteria bacterium]
MKNSLVSLVILVLIATGNVCAQNLIGNPETVVWDSSHNRYLVSEMGPPNNIVEIDEFGSHRVFFEDTYFHHAMTIVGNTLYAACNRNQMGGIVGIDLDTREVVFENLQTAWLNWTNGVAADTSGYLYFTFGASSFYRMRLSDGQTTLRSAGQITVPNGLHFDSLRNRILICAELNQPGIWEYDVSNDSLFKLSLFTKRYSCMTEDQAGNFYTSVFFDNQVLRYDSSLSGSSEIVATGDGPEGICFNKLHSTLVVPNLNLNTIEFIPMDVDLWMTADTLVGPPPLAVQFVGASAEEIVEWSWVFGDAGTASVADPSHVYETGGLYDITMRAVTVSGDTLVRVYPNHVSVLSDSLWAGETEVARSPGEAALVIYARNNLPLSELVIPIEFSGSVDLTFDSVSTAGCRSEGFEVVDQVDYDPEARQIAFRMRPRDYGSPLYVNPGSGPVLKMYFQAAGSQATQTEISVGAYVDTLQALFVGDRLEYSPETINGSVGIAQCCFNKTGNVNFDPDDVVDIGDLTSLIDYLFISYSEPHCLAEANTDGEGTVDIGDLTGLITYLFIFPYPALADCP